MHLLFVDMIHTAHKNLRARRSAFTLLLCGTSLLALGGPSHAEAPESPFMAGQAALQVSESSTTSDVEITEALRQAAAYGSLSVLASVVENTRLTPWRSAAIGTAALGVLPGSPQAVAKAIEVGQILALRDMPQTALQAARQLPPGADPRVSLLDLGEDEANFGRAMIGTEAADALGLTGAGVTVGVIDTGIARRLDGTVHSEFAGRIDPRSRSYFYWIDKSLTEAEAEADPAEAQRRFFDQAGAQGWEDVDSHGTHVAGIIGAARDGIGMVGIASGVNILSVAAVPTSGEIGGVPYSRAQECGPVLFTSQGEDCNALYAASPTADALRFLAQQDDVRIANGSFGPEPDAGALNSDVSGDVEDLDALSDFVLSGKIYVAAAGNEYVEAPVLAESPSGLALAPFVGPDTADIRNSAGVPLVIGADGLDYSHLRPDQLAEREAATGESYGRVVAVIAVDATKEIASYSNRCGVTAQWCIAAPGGDFKVDADGRLIERPILSAIPENLAQLQPNGDPFPPYNFYNGTSMAAPHVAGALAVLIEAYPAFAPGKIVDIMFSTAEDLGATGIDEIYGHGLLRLDRALQGPIGLSADASVPYQAKVAQSHQWTFDFSSPGALFKSGGGTLRTNAGTSIGFGGGTRVEDGNFIVDGRFSTPTLFVAQGAGLGGSGLIDGNARVAGDLAPGSSPGVLTFTGTVALDATARTTIEIDGRGTGQGAGNYDRVVALGVGNAFTAGGTLAPTLRGITGSATNSFVPDLGDVFTFVHTPNGVIAGSFGNVAQPGADLPAATRFDVLYASQALSLVLTPQDYGDLAAAGIAVDAGADLFGRALQAQRPTAGIRPDAARAAIFDPLYQLPAAQIGSALSAASGTIYADVGQEALFGIGGFSDTLLARRIGGPQGAGAGAWWTPSLGGVSVRDGSQGYTATRYEAAAGIDGAFDVKDRASAGHLGFAGSYTHSALSDANGSAGVNVFQGGLYGSLAFEGIVVSAAGGLSYTSADVRRFSVFGRSTGSVQGLGGFADLTLSRPFEFASVAATPFAGIGYRGLSRGATSESGAFALGIARQTFDQTFVTAGVEISGNATFGTARIAPSLKVAYRGDLSPVQHTSANVVLGTPFDATGARIGRHAILGSVGASATLSPNVSLAVSYDAELRRNLTSHGARVNFTARW